MTACETYFAIIKGYTTISLFTLPIGFKYGGWLFSPLVLAFSCFIETTSAIKLSQAAAATRIYSYTDLVEYTFGRTYKYFFQTFVAVLHFCFSFNVLTYFAKALRAFFKACTQLETDLWIWAIVTFLVFAPISWVRTVERFKVGYIYAVCTIILMIIIVGTFCSMRIYENDNDAGRDWSAFNDAEFLTMIGLSFYQYEGIGTILPIMEASDAKPLMSWLIGGALATLCTFHIIFSELIYYAYGDDIIEPIIIFQIPQDNWFVIIAEVLFLGNIIFSYPLNIYITNYVLEGAIFGNMRYSECRKWLKNLSRSIVVAAGIAIGVAFYYILPKIVSVVALVVGTTVVIITPALLHNAECAGDSTYMRVTNWMLVVYAVLASIFLTFFLIYSWTNGKGGH